MKKPQFIHLHLHSEYSLLDGLCRIPDLVQKLKELQMPAAALTDHGVMYGVIPFYTAMKKAGLNPIIGCEVYLAPRTRFQREARDREYHHLTLLCENTTGYHNLIKIVTQAHLEGFYYKPRVDYDLLSQYHEGIICLTGCRGSRVTQYLLRDQYSAAREEAGKLKEIFGADNVFVELQVFDTVKKGSDYRDSLKLKKEGTRLARDLDLGIVATGDVHYLNQEDAYAQEILICIQTKQSINDPHRTLSMVETPDFYLRSAEEMSQLFADLLEALSNTVEIAQRCRVEIETGKLIYPQFPLPPGQTAESYLRQLVEAGLQEKYPSLTSEIRNKVEYELDIITGKNYATYFLICHDLAQWARKRKIPISTRGSVSASIVAYALGITNFDPLQYKLPFERFMSRERPSPPDIDFDIAEDKRPAVIDYVYQKYGRDHVAQIITFGRMESRAVIRDVARVLDLPLSLADRLAKMIPPGQKIKKALDEIPELQQLYQEDRTIKNLIDLAQKLEGVVRHASTHACGLVITPEPLINYVPLQKETKGGENIITQYDMYALDVNAVGESALGLLKLDLLGLTTLSLLRQTTEMIKERQGEEIDIYHLPQREEVYKMLSEGHSTGVFQLEGAGMRRLLRQMQPQKMVDLMATIALYRPGPMDLIPQYLEARHDPQKIKYPHPDLEEILAETYGVLIFQEQCMAVVSKMGGYTQGRADILRRAIGKKKKDLMQQEKKEFIAAAQKQGYSKKEATEVFSYIETFANYGFNKSHTAAYALIAYQTAYLKYFYPLEFMTSLFNTEIDRQDKFPIFAAECQRLGLNLLPPEINQSEVFFSISGEKTIRFGLSAIKNVGQKAVEEIIAARKAGGPFRDFLDFCQRLPAKVLNKRIVESLIKSGALDVFGPRAALLEALPQFLRQGLAQQRSQQNGQRDLFSLAGEKDLLPPRLQLPPLPEVNAATKVQWEEELLGLHFTADPQEEKLKELRDFTTHDWEELNEINARRVRVGGRLKQIRRLRTKKSQRWMAFLQFQPAHPHLEVVVFPALYAAQENLLREGQIFLLEGKVEKNQEKTSFIVNNLIPWSQLQEEPFCRLKEKEIEIQLPRSLSPTRLEELKQFLLDHPGPNTVRLLIPNNGSVRKIKLPFRVHFSRSEQKEILRLLLPSPAPKFSKIV